MRSTVLDIQSSKSLTLKNSQISSAANVIDESFDDPNFSSIYSNIDDLQSHVYENQTLQAVGFTTKGVYLQPLSPAEKQELL